MAWRMYTGFILIIEGADLAEKYELMAGRSGAVDKILCGSRTLLTLTNDFGILCKVDCHSRIEGIERSLPKSRISAFLAVSNDSTFDLINLAKASVFHH